MKHVIPPWLQTLRNYRKADDINEITEMGPDTHVFVTPNITGAPEHYYTSRAYSDDRETSLLRDVAFNNHEANDGEHVSPFDNGRVQVGSDGIIVELVQGVPDTFTKVIGMATRATIGVDLSVTSVDEATDADDADEMMRGGLQTALEDAVVVFAVSGVSRTCTHQLVRTRNAAYHQQSQRASYYGDKPEARMPESVWRNMPARQAFMAAVAASHQAYRVACEAGISYQDARYILPEGTDNYIMCEYPLREFIKVFDYRGCSMFSWEIVTVMRMMRAALIQAHPWLEPHIKISCERTPPSSVPLEPEYKCPECGEPAEYVYGPETTEEGDPVQCANGHQNYTKPTLHGITREEYAEQFEHKCTFQGWESVEGQCPFAWAKERNRTFQPKLHKIASRAEQDLAMVKAGGTHKQTHIINQTGGAQDAWAIAVLERAGLFERDKPINDAKVATVVEWLAKEHQYAVSPNLVKQLLQAYGWKRLKASMSLNVNPDDLVCETCGRDNRNGTHDALEGMHLNHSFAGITPEEYLKRQRNER